ncbi:FixH family protein [Neisseria leonii]|uniref:FixH family protein n=1 Tax=Neisseria leonii TaxID=2995413 RepID=A0A9X4IAE3_9NEIS|nr:FixH family protein [Neisseria sp. 51.81]MDD9327310.1 FixH family protein [Neisseria sp. 51.81]
MSERQSKVWYKEPWPWILMAGPMIVVIAGLSTFYIAKTNMADLVSDDYYKEGKYIDLNLKRDREALKRNMAAQVLVSPEGNSAKVFVSGDFDRSTPLKLVFLHPAKKEQDQTVELSADQAVSGDKALYSAAFRTLPKTQHWYVRVEDAAGVWRLDDKWIVSQGHAVNLQPKDYAKK